MINFINGTLREARDGMIVAEAFGIGFGIRVPLSVLSELPPIGSEVKIHTYFSVRQDAMELFGFLHREDRDMFVQLLSVSGVGPKGALGILSTLKPNALRQAILSGNSKLIQTAPGIGKRTAERLILDLRDKVDAGQAFAGTEGGKTTFLETEFSTAAGSAAREAEEALIALGFSSAEASRAIRNVDLKDGMNADEILKLSLRQLSF